MITPYSNIISVTTLSSLLLDTYSGAAAAYSLRKLRSAYTGNAIQVRRQSDNATQNIGFNSLGELDTSALTTFCSGTNGFVTTWYDQSGNGYNATQTTAANQPQIVSSGSVIMENSKPSLRFNQSYLQITSVLLNHNDLSIYFVTLPKTPYTFGGILTNKRSGFDNAAAINYNNLGRIEWVYQSGNFVGQAITQTSLFLGTALSDTSNITLRTNSVQNNSILKTGVQIFGNSTWMGSYRLDANNLGNFTLSETIVYQFNQSTNNANIENNIKNYYAI